MKDYKLIRDGHVPNILDKSRLSYCSIEESMDYLLKKIQEETFEVIQESFEIIESQNEEEFKDSVQNTIEEAADVLQTCISLIHHLSGISEDAVQKMITHECTHKRGRLGSFKSLTLLDITEDTEQEIEPHSTNKTLH